MYSSLKDPATLTDTTENQTPLTNRILRAVDQNLIYLDFTQSEAAKILNISPRTLNRHLHLEGTTFKTIMTNNRIASAKFLLANTELSVGDIADKLGLSCRRTLDRMFIKEVGLSPAQHRVNLTLSVSGQNNEARLPHKTLLTLEGIC